MERGRGVVEGVSRSVVFPWPEYRIVTLSFCRGQLFEVNSLVIIKMNDA